MGFGRFFSFRGRIRETRLCGQRIFGDLRPSQEKKSPLPRTGEGLPFTIYRPPLFEFPEKRITPRIALRSGRRMQPYGIKIRFQSGGSARRSGRRGRWFKSTHPGHFFQSYIVNAPAVCFRSCVWTENTWIKVRSLTSGCSPY